MGSSYSCPQNYTSIDENVYKSTVHLCIKRVNINNISVISDITSNAQSLNVGILTILCLIICTIILSR